MTRLLEVSFNVSVPGTPLEDTVKAYSQRFPMNVYGDKHATVILPEYRRAFIGSILLTMNGVVMRNTVADNSVARVNSIFGFIIDENATYYGEPSAVFHPEMDASEAKTLEDPMLALDRYHGSLIEQTNTALSLSESPYRLAPLTD